LTLRTDSEHSTYTLFFNDFSMQFDSLLQSTVKHGLLSKIQLQILHKYAIITRENPMKLRQLLENQRKLTLSPLPYARDALEPVMSRETVIYHYDHLTKAYVDRFNSGEGDPDFNEAGAYLHELFWAQLRAPRRNNQPVGQVLKLIEDRHGSYDDLRDEFTKSAKALQGSGWVYMAKDGAVKTIHNHKIRRDAVLPIDIWEHSWALQYKWDKDAYLKSIWRVIDWDVINHRLAGA
jgi:superoxide dismutase, Fe-Mn family